MRFLNKIASATFTNKESVFEVLNAVSEYDDVVKELKFQAQQAKQNPDASAQEMLDSVQANILRMERITAKLKKELGL